MSGKHSELTYDLVLLSLFLGASFRFQTGLKKISRHFSFFLDSLLPSVVKPSVLRLVLLHYCELVKFD